MLAIEGQVKAKNTGKRRSFRWKRESDSVDLDLAKRVLTMEFCDPI